MAGARAGSAPPGPRGKGAPDPTRSQSAGGAGLPPPRLRPLFLWVRQQDTAVVQVHCEDYDSRNRLRLSRTPLGWRVLPRTETFDAIKLPPAPPPARRARPARRSRARRRTALATLAALDALPTRPPVIDLPPPSPAARATPSHSPEPDPTRPRLTDSEEGSRLTTGSGQEEDNSPDRSSEVDPESSKDNNSRSAWNLPDIEISIPSHTIHIPQRLERQERSVSPRETSLPERDFNPTPLDKLLAVAELEFNQQQTASPELEEPSPDSGEPASCSSASETLHRQFTKFPFLSEDESDRDIVAFDNIPDNVQNVENDEGFFSQKPSENKIIDDEGVFQSGIAAKDLFESITESHYMPVDLDNHDHETINANELLDSLVEKGCEDHNIIGNDFDKIAHIVSSNGNNHIEGDYDEDDEEMLMDDAPVSDIIHRLEQSLDSPGQNSMSAAQGLLHLQQMTDDLAEAHLMGNVEENLAYSEETFDKTHEPLSEISQLNEEMNTPLDEQENIQEGKVEADEELDEVLEEQQLSNNPAIQDEVQSEMENENNENVESEDYSSGEQASESDSIHATSLVKVREDDEQISNKCEITLEKEENHDSSDDMMPTDLSINTIAKGSMDNVDDANDDLSNKSDEMPKDLSCRKRPASPCPSPQRVFTSRPVSRGSDTVQSPQPSGIPAVPPSPELFPTPHSRSNSKSMFLETLLASPSPKMCFSSELTITKHQNEPLNLGKSRKSASPTVSSCSEEVKKTKTFGEPEEKRSRKEIPDEAPLQKLNKLFSKANEIVLENKPKKADSRTQRSLMDLSSVEQLQLLRCSTEFDIPDPLLVPKDRFSAILASPAREIPALLIQRPELRLPEAFAYPAVLQDPDILVVSLSQLEGILLKHRHALEKEKQREQKEQRDHKEHKEYREHKEHKESREQREHRDHREHREQREHREPKEHREHKEHKQSKPTTPLGLPEISKVHSTAPTTPSTPTTPKSTSISSLPMAPTTPTTPLLPSALIAPIPPPITESSLRSMAGMGAGPAAEAMAGDIEAATSAAFNQMIWLPYLSQFEAAMACSQNSDILKALNSTAIPPGYPTQAAYPDLSQMFSQQQRFMNTSQFPGMPPIDYSNQLELAMWQEVVSQPNGSNFQRLKSAETQNLFAQAAKIQHHHQQQARGHSARTSPITRGWRGAAGAAAAAVLPPSGVPGVLPPFPWAGYPARAPHPSQYSPGARSRHHQPPPSPSAYYQNNNYMSSAKAPRESRGQAHAASAAPHQGEQRPRITVKSLQNLLEPPEVGSSTHPPEELPHDPQTPLWHPLFGNQKNYNSPWNWTTVTVNGD